MNPHDDETVFAYVDGELEPAARAQFEALLAQDAELALRVEAQLRLRRTLGDAFDPTLLESVPERLQAAARRSPIAETAIVPRSPVTRPPRALRHPATTWFAWAASLVLGILIGQRWPSTSNPLVVAGADGAVARGVLAEALDARLQSAAQASGGPIDVGISYRSRSGEFCRTFAIDGAHATQAGIACHTASDEWRIALLDAAPGAAASSGPVRQAGSGALPESVRRAVEATIAGDALDAAGEAAARDSGWRALGTK